MLGALKGKICDICLMLTITDPVENEHPSHYANRLGILYSKTVTKEHKKENGQFFTPIEIADFMANQVLRLEASLISVLDPGCGVGILSCSLLTYMTNISYCRSFHLTAYETDKNVLPFTTKVLDYLKRWLRNKEVELNYSITNKDFILDSIAKIENKEAISYDFIISNPPYFKLGKSDTRLIAAANILKGHTNIYSLFATISIRLLKENGEMIFIVPRSFTAGSYFKSFRQDFFKNMALNFVHLFDSRKDTFSKDKVLQELLIFKASKIEVASEQNYQLEISTSHGLSDIQKSQLKEYSISDLVNLDSIEKMLHLPVNEKEEAIIELARTWDFTLSSFGIQVSTGPVVSFRSLENIHNVENNTLKLLPLFWLHNVKKMHVEWPLPLKNKGQFIEANTDIKSALLLNKNYVLLRRFSSKDDKSRLIAAPYFSEAFDTQFIGVENKLNYIYRPGGDLAPNEIVGLAAVLNSELFDTYFKTFNGNVNVSATELREMHFPPIEMIKELGDAIILNNNFDPEKTNSMVNAYFNFQNIFV